MIKLFLFTHIGGYILNTLENCELFKLLTEKSSENKEQYISILRLIEKPVGDLLEFTKTNFPNYTDHTIQHSYRILRYLSKILSRKMKDNLNATEIFCLILAAMLHDIGMSNSTEKDIEKLRNEHGRFAEEPINKLLEQLKIVSNIKRISNCVIYVCESHTKELQKLYAEPKLKKTDTINGEKVRYGYLTILLRVGDLLDMEEDRTSYIVNVIFPNYYLKDDSLKHHRRCEELVQFDYSYEKIVAVVETVDRENYKLWTGWFMYLKDEIVQANTYYFREFVEGESIPQFEYEIKPAEGANFCTEEIRFEIDDKGALWEIISNSVYTAEFDFIRELVQNAVDACLMECFLNKDNKLECAFQRTWPTKDYCVEIMYSEIRNELVIHDNGVGMAMETLKRYLFKTADSGYRHLDVDRDFSFPAIARFGIGFVACLTKAKTIKLYTQEVNAKEEIGVEIEEKSNLAFIERREKTEFHGTIITLKLKEHYSHARIEKYLKSYFRETAVRIELLNLDILNKIIGDSEFLMPENLNDFTSFLKKKRAFINESKIYHEKNNQCDTLRQIMINISSDDIFPLKKIVPEHAKLIELLNSQKTIIDKEIISKIGKYTETSIDTDHNEYERLLTEIIKILNNHQNDNLNKTINDYDGLMTEISINRCDHIFDKDVCIIYLNNNFYIEDVSYKIELEKIKSGRGIIIIRTECEISKYGIEFEIANAFLFQEGVLTNSLLKVRSNNYQITDDGGDAFVALDEIYDIQYQLELEFQEEEEVDKYNKMVKDLQEEKYSYRVDILYGDRDIKLLRDISAEKINEQKLSEGVKFLDTDIYSSIEKIGMVPHFENSLFCQDGIKINIDISGLIPFKTGNYKCNLFGESRFELNITRHDINRDSTLLNKWMEKYGVEIQKKVIKNVKKILKNCGMENVNLNEYIKNKNDDIFDKSAFEQFSKLLELM